MINVFIIIVFLAELIIAAAVIGNIIKFNKNVNSLNNIFAKSKTDIKLLLIDIRDFFRLVNDEIFKMKKFVEQKKEEYTIKALKTSIIYLSILLLKGKYKKAIFAYQIAKEIYDGFSEVEFG